MGGRASYNLIPLDRFEPIPTGESATAYDEVKYYGKQGFAEDLDYSNREKPYLSGLLVEVRMVKNNHSTTIPAGTNVKWKAAQFGFGVVPAGASENAAGCVPWYMPEAIPVGAWFPMIVHGPHTAKKESGEMLEGAFVVTAASGRVADETAGDYANDKAEVGMVLETSSGAEDTGIRIFVNLDR